LFNNFLGFNSPPLGAKVFDSHSNTQLFAAGKFILVMKMESYTAIQLQAIPYMVSPLVQGIIFVPALPLVM